MLDFLSSLTLAVLTFYPALWMVCHSPRGVQHFIISWEKCQLLIIVNKRQNGSTTPTHCSQLLLVVMYDSLYYSKMMNLNLHWSDFWHHGGQGSVVSKTKYSAFHLEPSFLWCFGMFWNVLYNKSVWGEVILFSLIHYYACSCAPFDLEFSTLLAGCEPQRIECHSRFN